MYVVNLIDEVARGLHRVHHLPRQVRGVHLQAHPRAVLERFEQRLPAYRTGGDVGSPRVGFPQDAHLVLFAHRKVILGVDLDDLIHLRLQGLALDGAGLSPDARYPQLAAQFEGLDGLLDLAGARRRVRIDVVPVAAHRRGVDAGRLDLVFDRGDGGIVQTVGVELDLPAREAFGLDELQV